MLWLFKFVLQDANGSMGFTANGIQNTPMTLLQGHTIVKITSGGDHLVCLTDAGEIYTCGKEACQNTTVFI